MEVKIALAGNPNSGKTTVFNALTGSNQFVGNWPGVTVKKKEGRLKNHPEVTVTDLPGIYSLSPYSPEEVVARNYLVGQRPDVILNIIDGTNLERNLYLTTQLTELGLPVVVAVNMMDLVKRNGDEIHTEELSRRLGCRLVEISALRGTGLVEAAEAAIHAAKEGNAAPPHAFSSGVEQAVTQIEEAALHGLPETQRRWYAVKLFEHDEDVWERLKLPAEVREKIERVIQDAEEKLDDDGESILANQRYEYIEALVNACCRKKNAGKLSTSDKIDRVVTNRWLGLPIFALVMALVYYIAMVTVGAAATDWANDGLFGEGWHLFGMGSSAYEEALEAYEEALTADPQGAGFEAPDPANYGLWVPGVPVLIGNGLDALRCADWLQGLILDGIVAGVGAVIGFLPQMLVLFLMLAFLEACGYMARIAFLMDRIFRRFGLSGKSFIPILIGTGCGVPGIMASRTIENERDRRMTILTTTFIPCGAKVPFISMLAGAVFGGSAWVATSAYFVGLAAIILSGILLKKTKLFAGEPAPFVMELPAYRWPTPGNILRSAWERGWSFVKKAGTVILLSCILVWFLSFFGFVNGSFTLLREDQLDQSLLAAAGQAVCRIFAPLGFGTWQAAAASVTGLIAKENIVGTLSILYGAGDAGLSSAFTPVSGYAYLVFNLLCAPCFAAIGAIRREMNHPKWTWFAIGYQCGFAYLAALCVNQIGGAFTGHLSLSSLIAAVAAVAFAGYLLLRPGKRPAKSR